MPCRVGRYLEFERERNTSLRRHVLRMSLDAPHNVQAFVHFFSPRLYPGLCVLQILQVFFDLLAQRGASLRSAVEVVAPLHAGFYLRCNQKANCDGEKVQENSVNPEILLWGGWTSSIGWRASAVWSYFAQRAGVTRRNTNLIPRHNDWA